jgi:hypothetical protein
MKITLLPTVVILMLVFCTTACSKENWYHGARSAQTAHCMNEPLSEYEDCNRQAEESYGEYDEKRKGLLEEETK